jgi:hypothetical protein
MKRLRNHIVDVFGLGAILVWFLLSAHFVYLLNEDLFQRMGAFGVAAAISYYGFVELYRLPPVPYGLNERLIWISKTLDVISKSVSTALSNNTVIAVCMKNRSENRGERTEEPIRVLANQIEHAITVGERLAAEGDHVPQELEANLKMLEDANDIAKRERQSAHSRELFLGAIATLQWGFGDLLVKSHPNWSPIAC